MNNGFQQMWAKIKKLWNHALTPIWKIDLHSHKTWCTTVIVGVTNAREEVYAICDNQETLLPAPGSWVALEVATILSPGRFYAILPMGNKSLHTIQSAPSQHSSKLVACFTLLVGLLRTAVSNYSVFNFLFGMG